MITINLKKDLKAYYQPPVKRIEIIQIPRFTFLMIDGAIEKGQVPDSSPEFQETTGALYGAAYTLKFMLKKRTRNPLDYPVMALEGLWDTRDGGFDIRVKDNWLFTMMILVPDRVTSGEFDEAIDLMRNKQGDQPAFARLRLDRYAEGLVVQATHVGPYATEPGTLNRMRAFIEEEGYRDLVGSGGKHHEIYLGDPRKSAPDKLKTILRHPVARRGG